MLAFATKVGPLDGKAGPSLRPLGSPGGIQTEVLPDTGFPKELERLGDLPSAAVEWQRLAYQSHGKERELALTNAARLNIAMGNPNVASRLISELINDNPATQYAPEALFHIATGSYGDAQANAFRQLQEKFPGNPWTTAAQMSDVWKQAEAKGRIKQTYGLEAAEKLKQRINMLRVEQQKKIAVSGAMGVILPGAGHAYAGNIPQGVTVFIFWCLFTLAFLSACRHRHFAYSFLFVIPSVSLWLTSPIVAMEIVRDETKSEIAANLQKWTDLQPQLPNAPKAPETPVSSAPATPPEAQATTASPTSPNPAP
ncbi:MAG: hypothetical protein DI585_00335 [Pseudomonas fluorescens]|nr:MAG: hypothetical protein DI585_00335 [Pseudomonas fluorescens]